MTTQNASPLLLVTAVMWLTCSQPLLTTAHEVQGHQNAEPAGQSMLGHVLDFLISSSQLEATKLRQMREELDSLKASLSQKTEEVNQLQQTLASLSAQVSTQGTALDRERKHSAFLATFSGGVLRTPPSGPYQFDHVIFNDGGDYDPILGVYEAPYDGVYSLAAQIWIHPTTYDLPRFEWKVNGQVRNRVALILSTSGRGGEHTVYSALNFQLKAGDKIWIEGYDGRTYSIYGNGHCFFSGALLYAQ